MTTVPLLLFSLSFAYVSHHMLSADDATELKWEFDEEHGRYYVSFPDDQ